MVLAAPTMIGWLTVITFTKIVNSYLVGNNWLHKNDLWKFCLNGSNCFREMIDENLQFFVQNYKSSVQ